MPPYPNSKLRSKEETVDVPKSDDDDEDEAVEVGNEGTQVTVESLAVIFVRAPSAGPVHESNLGMQIPNLWHSGNGPYIVTAVDENASVRQYIQPGDQLLAVDATSPTNNTTMARLLSKAESQKLCTITSVRERSKFLAGQTELRRRLIDEASARAADYSYFVANVEFRKDGPPLGLLIKHRSDKVIVSRVEPNGLARLMVQHGDMLLDVNGIPVNDKEVAKAIIVTAMQRKEPFSMLIERPTSVVAKKEMEAMLASTIVAPSTDQFTEILLPPDVLSILNNELRRRQDARKLGRGVTPSRSLMHTAVSAGSSATVATGGRSQMLSVMGKPMNGAQKTPKKRKVSIAKRQTDHRICSSVEPNKYLKHIGKRHS